MLIGVALALAGGALAAWIGLAAFAAHLGWQITRLEIGDPALVPAGLQIQPRCRADVVCRTAGRCGDARGLSDAQRRARISRGVNPSR